jgi:hypothetical protein
VAFLVLGIPALASSAKDAYLEESSFVQSQVLMGKGKRRVEPLGADEELEDEEGLDDDTPSLMQAEVCRTKSKSRIQPIVLEDDEELSDEMSALQTTVTLAPRKDIIEDNSIEEDDEDEVFAAMQTEVTMVSRHDREDDAFDGASFIQSEATVIEQTQRHCNSGLVEALEDDVVSLIQTGADVHPTCTDGNEQSCSDDTASYMQAGAMVQKSKRRIGGEGARRSVDSTTGIIATQPAVKKVDDDEEEKDESVFFQMGVTLSKAERRVGKAPVPDEDELLDDGASFIQAEVVQERGCQSATGDLNSVCRRSAVGAYDDEEEEDDVTSL